MRRTERAGRGEARAAGRLAAGLAVATALVGSAAGAAGAAGGATTRASVGTGGAAGDFQSATPALSADGRLVAFASSSTTLVAGDTNGASDVFVRDRTSGTTARVSLGAGSRQAGAGSGGRVAISADGRYVAFESFASDLVGNDANGRPDVFVRDRTARTTALVSVGAAGRSANGSSTSPSISADGRRVAFESDADDLVAGDANDLHADVFVRDATAGTTAYASVDSAGRQGNAASGAPSISADGRFVAFESAATGFAPGDTADTVDLFVRNVAEGRTVLVSVGPSGQRIADADDPAVSANGRYVAFTAPGDVRAGAKPGTEEVLVRDRWANTTTRASLGAGGQAPAAYSVSLEPSISADGRYVAFSSTAANLVAGDTNGVADAFVRDRVANTTARASVRTTGAQADGASFEPAISADGRRVGFSSFATNLVAGDANGQLDVFVHER